MKKEILIAASFVTLVTGGAFLFAYTRPYPQSGGRSAETQQAPLPVVDPVQKVWEQTTQPIKPDFTEMDKRHEQMIGMMGAAMNASIAAQKKQQQMMEEMQKMETEGIGGAGPGSGSGAGADVSNGGAPTESN